MSKDLQEIDLTSLLPDDARALLERSGLDFVEREGLDSIRDLVLDVYMGKNHRDFTESITRDRLSILGLGLLQFYLEGMRKWPGFIDKLPFVAANNIQAGRMSKGEKWLNNWVLGLTGKGIQNVLRDDPDAIFEYADSYVRSCKKAAEDRKLGKGQLAGQVGLSQDHLNEFSWEAMVFLQNTIGSATLTIRGSDKSTFGKTLEKPVLGSVFYVLGFDYVDTGRDTDQEGVYWLNHTAGRESDATLILKDNKAFRFDIGFIGRGNTEISLDKVTRYRNEMEVQGKEYFVKSIVLVDRIGDKSTIRRLAEEAQAKIFTMDTPLWPREVAQYFDDEYSFDHPLVGADDETAKKLLQEKVNTAPFRRYLRIARGEENDSPKVRAPQDADQSDMFDGE